MNKKQTNKPRDTKYNIIGGGSIKLGTLNLIIVIRTGKRIMFISRLMVAQLVNLSTLIKWVPTHKKANPI